MQSGAKQGLCKLTRPVLKYKVCLPVIYGSSIMVSAYEQSGPSGQFLETNMIAYVLDGDMIQNIWNISLRANLSNANISTSHYIP